MMSRITELAAKNEYVEARLQQAVDIIMLGEGMAGGTAPDGLGIRGNYTRPLVMEDMRLLLDLTSGYYTYSSADRDYFQRALDIVNLPRLLASASSGVVQGTKHE